MELLERRLIARQIKPRVTLFDLTIDEIDATEQTTWADWEKMEQLKNDIIRRCIATGRGVVETLRETMLLETGKYSVKRDVDEFVSEWQFAVINAIEIRRLHIIERASYITRFELATNFKNK